MNDTQKYLGDSPRHWKGAWEIFLCFGFAFFMGLSVWLSAKRNDLRFEVEQLRLDKAALEARFERHGDEARQDRWVRNQKMTAHDLAELDRFKHALGECHAHMQKINRRIRAAVIGATCRE